MTQNFFSNGKLLITGEYVVLDGARALAVPAKFGQSLEIQPGQKGTFSWKALDREQNTWFETRLRVDGETFPPENSNPGEQEKKLLLLYSEAYKMNPKDFKDHGDQSTTRL